MRAIGEPGIIFPVLFKTYVFTTVTFYAILCLSSKTKAKRERVQMVFNITIVYMDGTSSGITNYKAESRNAAFMEIVQRNINFKDNEMVSITIIERKREEF